MCDKKFTTKHSRTAHYLTHIYTRPYICLTCSIELNSVSSLNVHHLTHEKKVKVSCPKCNELVLQNVLSEHIKSVHEDDRTSSLDRHKDEKPFSCCLCNELFNRKKLLFVHICDRHKDENTYICKKRGCGKVFSTQSYLTAHTRVHLSRKPYLCGMCGKAYESRQGLAKHNKIHANQKKENICCPQCNENFPHGSLPAHIKSVHQVKKLHSCDEWGKTFCRKEGLANHKLTHTCEKPFKCEECDKFFTMKHNLSRHMRIHTGEKPFEYVICGNKFASNAYLTKHIGTHTGQRPYTCQMCGDAFKSKHA